MKASGGIVFEGVIDGNNGDNGYNTAQVALYRRSATALTNNDRPTGTLTYTFSTGRVSGASSYYNGWSQSIPEMVAGTKLYVIMAIARSQSDTDDIAASDWSTPVEYVADGVNSAPVFIYKRNKTQPTDKPADGATYYFKKVGSTEAGTLSGTLNGWSTQIPATDSNHYPCWVRQAMAVSNGNTDVINASEWSDPATKLLEDGISPYFADLDNEMDSVACTHDGKPSSEQTVETNVSLYHGSTKLTPTISVRDDSPSGAAYTNGTAKGGITITWNNATGNIKVKFSTTPTLANVTTFCITLSATVDGETITRNLYFKVNGVRASLNGDPAALYRLVPSIKEIVKKKDNTYVPTGNTYITCDVTKNVGGTQSTPATSEYSLKYSLNGGSETDYTATSIKVNQVISNVVFILRVNNVVVDRETIGLITDGTDGTSPYFADLDNEMDSVACTHDGKTSSAYDKTINLKLWHGSSPMDLTKLSYKVNNGTEYTTEQTINNIKVTPNSSAKTIRIRVENNKSLAETNDITIIIAGTGSGDQTLHFILNGVRAGANGDPVTLYSLLPSMDVVTKDKDGVPTLDLMTFKIIKRVGTTETEITTVSQFSTEGLSLFYKKGNNSEVEVTTSYMSDYGTSINYHDIESLYDGYSGVIDWVLRKNNTLLDREGIGSVQNGATGDMGYSIALTLTRNNLYTEANWNTYAEIGHSESYSKRTGDSDLTTCRVGDYFVVTGKASDSLLTHTATYKCTSVSASSITGTCISHTHDGANGDDAVTYQIVYSEAWAKVNSSNIISARLRGHAYKIVGSTRTAMAGATIMMGYVLNNTSSQYPNIETTTDANGYFSENDWFNGDEYGSSGYVQGSQVIFAAIVVNNIVKCVEYITMTLAGAKGDTGRMYYIAGEFPQKAPYTRTDKLCPVVYYATEWWYLDAASATGSDTPSDGSNKWKKIANFGVVLTDAIFVKNFAQFGSAIITGDWLISVHGMIGNTFYGGSVENPDEYQGRAAYTYFDPAYPWGYDPFQLPVTNEEIETNKLTSWTRITDNFKLPAGTYTFNITCYANSSDTLHLRLFYGDESADDLYLGSTGSDEAVTLTFTKTLTSKSDWNVRATMEASGEIGYIVSVEVAPNDARFIPNYAVDLRTGRTYQSDANIKGSIQCIGPTSKVMIEDGVIRFFGSLSFPNIVLGVNEDGCAVLNFYDKNGNFKYGLGPDEIFRTKSQAESMMLKFYNVDAGSYDCTSLTNAAVVMLYLYMFKNQLTNDLVNGSLYKYLAKIASGVYGPGDYCASSADAQKYNEKIIKNGYSASAKLKDSDVYSGGGIVVTTGRTTSGIINKLSYMLNGETVDELDYRGYNVMQDSDFNKTKEGTTYYYRTKDTYNPVQAFYWDSSYPSSSPGGIGYEIGYTDKYYLNLCTNPADDDTLIDPVYYFNLMFIDSNGNNKGFKTLYINRKKLSDILQAAGKSL